MPTVDIQRRSIPTPFGIYTKTINGHEVTFNDVGYLNPGPAIVALSDWGQGVREFSGMMILLAQYYRVIAVCFRGHGINRDPIPTDFSYEEHARDVLGLLDALGVDRFVCLSAGQSCWAALDLAARAGRQRMISLLLFEVLMAPLATQPALRQQLAAMQSPSAAQSRAAVLAYHRPYSEGSSFTSYNGDHVYVTPLKEWHMGGTGPDTWALAARCITQAYDAWTSPLQRLEALADPPLVHHLYGHPDTKEYEALHKDFAKRHPQWFSYRRKKCHSKFPHMEHQRIACEDTIELMGRAMARKTAPQAGASELFTRTDEVIR